VRAALLSFVRDRQDYRLTVEQVEGLGHAMGQADRGEFASDRRLRVLLSTARANAGRRAHREPGGTLGSIGIAAAPYVVALVGYGAKDGSRADAGRDRLSHAEKKFLSQYPALRARAPRDVYAGFFERHGKQVFITTLKEESVPGVA